MQEAMLYAIALRSENPTKADVLQALKEMDAGSALQINKSLPVSHGKP